MSASPILHTIQDEESDKPSVAPLTVAKSPPRTKSDASRLTRQPSTKSRRSSRSQVHMSPPLTPRTSRESLRSQPPQQAVFHNYLRAFYHFHPSITVSSSSDESSITVPISQGDVILVHSVHPNGWADGSLLASGARGWLPTNYCEPYDHPFIHNLLVALTTLWDLVRDAENGNVGIFFKQDYVRTIIAGVRFFLEQCQCLTRESSLIKEHSGLRRIRKGILGDLSSVVKTAKKINEHLKEDLHIMTIFELMDDIVIQAFRLVMRAVRFLDIYGQDAMTPPFDFGLDENRPPTPPIEPATESEEVQSAQSHTVAVDGDQEKTKDHNEHNLATPIIDQSARLNEILEDANAQTVISPISTSFSSPKFNEYRLSLSSAGTSVKRTSLMAHRVSHTGGFAGGLHENLVSEKLGAAHDSFLGFLGTFIGLHMQSRTSSELLFITQQAVISCRQLLRIAQDVWERDGRSSDALAEARDAMYDKLAELVHATKDMFTAAEQSGAEGIFIPDEGMRLVVAATGCVRCAGECATRARAVIEKIGDFEPIGLGILGPQEPDDVEEMARTSIDLDKPLPARPPGHKREPTPLTLSELKPLPATPRSPELAIQIPDRPLVTESPSKASIRSFTPHAANTKPLAKPPAFELSSSNASHEFMQTGPKRLSVKAMYSEVLNISLTDSINTSTHSTHVDGASAISQPSTRATTPDHSASSHAADSSAMSSFGSASELASNAESCLGVEAQVLTKTYVHELVYNKEGQVAGGSLPALIEQLTTHESTPDVNFVTAFYLTFRLFTTPVEFTQCLIDRFDYVGVNSEISIPVRLRVYNIFKGWLESHWQRETDQIALGLILRFATEKVRVVLPSVGKRLAELTGKVTETHAGVLVPRLLSAIGKVGSSSTIATDGNLPNSIISKTQLSLLKTTRTGGNLCGIIDFDPLELARQLTIIESKLFCAIQAEELLASEWTKKVDSKAINVRAMSTLSTDLANLVADTILQSEDVKKRALVIKQWVKIGMKCLELHNYDSLMAIICSLNSSMILRLKRTWELVSQKTKTRLDDLRSVVDVGRNYAVLRQRLQTLVAPCIPFVGLYLTDLTFVDVGNQTTRQLPTDGSGEGTAVINFDKHMRTAKIIGQLQSFQVSYKLLPVPEMQEWIESQTQRVQLSEEANIQGYYRRSLFLEPRELQPTQPQSQKNSPLEAPTSQFASAGASKDRFDFFFGGLHFGSSSAKEKLVP